MADESSLRHRGMLVPYQRRSDAAAPSTDYSNIERALRSSMCWTRAIKANGQSYDYDWSGAYPEKTPRWCRFNANFGSANYEGNNDGNGKGWRSLLTEDEPFAIRRHMFTTLSRQAVPGPDITQPIIPQNVAPPAPPAVEPALDHRLRELWYLGMDWPVFIV